MARRKSKPASPPALPELLTKEQEDEARRAFEPYGFWWGQLVLQQKPFEDLAARYKLACSATPDLAEPLREKYEAARREIEFIRDCVYTPYESYDAGNGPA